MKQFIHSTFRSARTAILLSLAACIAAPASANYTATVDPTIQFQTWQGWGTSLAWWAKVVGGFPEPARSDYMDKAFDPVKGLGLNIVRYNIGGGENPEHMTGAQPFLAFRAAVPGYEPSPGIWDWTADANQRWVLQEAVKRGANQLEAFSNSPPWWMTQSGSVTGNHGGADNLKPEDDAAFADYLAAVVKHFHDTWGITFRDVEPLNEPSGKWWTFGGGSHHQEGCHVDRPHQNEVVKATEAALARQGISYTTVTASDESWISDADLTFGVYDETTLRGLSKINTHSYAGGDRTELFDFAQTHGKDLWMSEYGDNDPSGMHMSREILSDVNGLHPTAWVTWQVVDGGKGWGCLRSLLKDGTTTDYTINKKYYVLGQYSKFIRPGCRLVAITDSNSLAAYDARTNRLVIVTTNSGAADTAVTYDLSGFTRLGASVTAYRTSPTEDLAKLPDQTITGSRFVVTVPAQSVTTYLIDGAAYSGSLGFNPLRSYTLVSRSSGGKQNQTWGLLGVGGGWYKIINRASGLVLDLGPVSPAAEVLQDADSGSKSQQWHFEPATGGAFKVINRRSGLLLSAAATGLTPQADTGNSGQLWRVQPVETGIHPTR